MTGGTLPVFDQFRVRSGPGYPWGQLVRRSRELSDGLTSLGDQDGVTVVEPDGRWYGLDPIHPRRRHLDTAWRKSLGPWAASGAGPARVKASPARWVRLRTATPQHWWLAGRQMGRTQPSARLGDGSTIRLY